MKYYLAEKVDRLIAGQIFTVTDRIGTVAWGIFATDDPVLVPALDALVAAANSGLYALSEVEYEAQLKKKPPGLAPLRVVQTKSVMQRIIEPPKHAVAEDKPPETPQPETVQEALKIGKVGRRSKKKHGNSPG